MCIRDSRHIIKAAHKLDKGGFTAAVSADNGKMLAVFYFEIDISEDVYKRQV